MKQVIRYASVCSGAEAFGPAWQRMGYESVFHAEIEKNAAAVLRFHNPTVPNHGDFTKIDNDYKPGFIQLLIGGTPCQSFSIAGLRGGLADARGNLTLGFLALATQLQCPWILWENVPGVLSADGGRAFGSFLGGLARLRYGFAYRILDAQYFGVPQRRKRVFVVGHLGDWRRAVAVLFERESLQGHPAPRREAGQRIADSLTVGANQCSGFPGDFVEAVGTVSARTCLSIGVDDAANGHIIAFDANQITSPHNRSNHKQGDPCHTLNAVGQATVAFGWQNSPSQGLSDSEVISPTLDKSKTPAIAFNWNKSPSFSMRCDEESTDTLRAHHSAQPAVLNSSAVRRLTPRECERLQGWADDWTRYGIDEKGKQYELSDSARYRIIGNGWAAPVVNWIAERIKVVDQNL